MECERLCALPGTTSIFFDDTHHYSAIFIGIDRKYLLVELGKKISNTPLKPPIHWILPLLSRGPLEHAFYSLAEMGVTSIQPVGTAKVPKKLWGSQRD